MRHFPSATAISFALAAAVWAAPAAAQDAPVGPAVEDSGLSDIVVTAQRREESLQDVPVSVSVLSGDTLGAITSTGADVRVLAGRVPSLNIESSFGRTRSEEHTSELQSLMRISYAVFCLNKKKNTIQN